MKRAFIFLTVLLTLRTTLYAADAPTLNDPVNAVAPPPGAVGYPSRNANLDALPGFRNPPPGHGEAPFWWWTGDPLDKQRLIWQLEQLHQKGISGVQVNYAHEDSNGWPTYAAEPPLFSEAWWRIWGRVADECRKRGMGIGLSTYTLDWTGANNLFRQLFYSKPQLNAFRLNPPPNTLNPFLAGAGDAAVRDFYQRFQEATPNKSPQGLNYFFNHELHIGGVTHVWNADFAADFQRRKGYDVTKFAKPGENRTEILVYNTLANHYLTVPTRYRNELTSGLIGPVTLLVTPKN